jgi:hypothetical protein
MSPLITRTGRPEQRQSSQDAAAGFERALRLLAETDLHAEALAATQCAADELALPREIDDDAFDARARQCLEVILDERLAADFQQRLRPRVGQRAHPFAAPGGQDHGAHSASRAKASSAGSTRPSMNDRRNCSSR